MIDEKKIDWEQRRYEIAKAAIQGCLAEPYSKTSSVYRDAAVADAATRIADGLIAYLKNETKWKPQNLK